MAGKRQHYVPQLLQRGFLDASIDSAELTWLHRRGADPRRVSIRDVGVEDYFYSRPSLDGSPTLDMLITDLERELGADVNAMRRLEPGSQVEASLAAGIVVHLVNRTAYIRSLFEQTFETFTDEAAARFSDPVSVRAMLKLDQVTPSPMLTDALNELLDGLPLEQHRVPRDLAQRIFLFIVREQIDHLIVQNASQLQPVFAQLLQVAPDHIRAAHNKSLAVLPEQNAWLCDLSSYDWRIEVADNAILPDSVALVVEGDGGYVPFLFANRLTSQAIILPLASRRLLVGRRTADTIVELMGFNAAAAACSDSFFIRSRKSEGRELVDLIGSRASQTLTELVERSFSNLVGEDRPSTEVVQRTDATASTLAPAEGFSFQIRCVDFGDTALAQNIGTVVEVLVRELTRDLPLHDLDGLTLASDYPAALRNLDRGDEQLPPVESRVVSYGTAVAKAVEVRRDGRSKTHIVMHASIALGLVDPQEEKQRSSIGMLANMLAGVAFASRYDTLFRRYAPPDAVSGYLHGAIASTPETYFTARTSAFVAPELGESYAQLVVDALAHAKLTVLEARLAYRQDGDLEQLLHTALPCVRDVLEHVASWLGHRDGLAEGIAFGGHDLPAHLRGEGLQAWLELLGRDLRAIFDAPPGSLDVARLFALDRHVERLLWMFQICPWLTVDGGMYVSVPDGNDRELLKGRQLKDLPHTPGSAPSRE